MIFGAYTWLNRDASDVGGAERTIRITEQQVNWLVETWTRQWQRSPTDTELQGLITDYLREELLAREARALELDRDDTVVRRRLAQKMDFMLEDTARLAEPTDADLRAIYDADLARFRTPPRWSFVQVYFSPDKRGKQADADARKALEQLRRRGQGADLARIGDALLLPAGLTNVDEQVSASQFGAEFARAVGAIAPGTWQGPIKSGYGLHLVLVTERTEGRQLSLEEARTDLMDLWQRKQEAAAKNAYFSGLLTKYDVLATDSVKPLLAPALATLRGTAP
ncbi:MAG: peptidyl-prolyl cis-trans isomerase [Burkholderiales bacterium]